MKNCRLFMLLFLSRFVSNTPNLEEIVSRADEPTANLDSKSTENLFDIMEKLNKEEKITFIFSTYDARVVNKARCVIAPEDGKIVSDVKKE